MPDLISSAQMRAAEATAIRAGRVTGLELMERAGEAVVAAMHTHWPDLGGETRILVLCGPGNNGGDGFVIARLLLGMGCRVSVTMFGDTSGLPPDAEANFHRWTEIGGTVLPLDPGEMQAEQPDMVVDALFGIGLRRPLEGLSELFASLAATPCVAVDIPSGLCADSGVVLGGWGAENCMSAELTVTFHRAKTGHYLADGPMYCGKLVVADIGLTSDAHTATVIGAPSAAMLAKRGKGPGHKFGHGHVLVLGGDASFGGAARLAARAALRVGAGLVTLAVPADALAENAARLDAVMLRPLSRQSLQDMLGDTRFSSVIVGPGFGLADDKADLIAQLLDVGARGRLNCVLDADALTLVARQERLRSMLYPGCVLTPHDGEFARLFPSLATRLSAPEPSPRTEIVRKAAADLGCTLLLKGAATVISSRGQGCRLHLAGYGREAPWLATAGAGDVLAGMIGGLLARGLNPLDSASVAAWLHVEAARSFGPGLISEDLAEELPRVFRGLGLTACD